MCITIKDFYPFNSWEKDYNGENWDEDSYDSFESKYLIDMTTNKRYWNESKNCVREKCFLLS